MLNEERNTSIRRKIVILIRKSNISKYLDQLKKDIRKILYSYTYIDKSLLLDDFKKIMERIIIAIHQRQTTKQLIQHIKLGTYNFDKLTLNKLKNMSKPKLILELHRLAKKITTIESTTNIKKFTFPNIYVSCANFYKLAKQHEISNDTLQSVPSYCHNKKLRITKKKLSEYLELFATDLLDPLKERYMFNIVISEKILNYFTFIKRPYESIEIMVS